MVPGALILILKAAGAAAAPESQPAVVAPGTPVTAPSSAAPDTGTTGGVDYRVVFEGSMSGKLGDLLEESSLLLTLADRRPATITALERRAAGDIKRLEAVLNSDGYYDGEVDYRVDASTDPVTVTVIVLRGDPYRLESFDILYVDGQSYEDLPTEPRELGVQLNRRVRAPDIVAAENRMESILWERGYPFGTVIYRRHVVDRLTHVMRITMTVDPGPKAGFGPLTIEGLHDVRQSYVRRICPWEPGQQYDRRLLDEYRQSLLDTLLFGSVALSTADDLDTSGNVSIGLQLTERPLRTVGAGLSWGTDEGWEGNAFWEHRNLFGEDEDLRVETRIGEIEQSLSTLFSKPRFRRTDQTLLAGVRVLREETDAYRETNLGAGVALERELNDLWDGKLGLTLELSDITENEDDRTLWLFGVPGSLVRDSRDDEMSPTRGTRLALGMVPFLTAGDEQIAFVITELGASVYKSMRRDDRIVLAGRTRVGSILGQSRSEIPASKRFYAGGGGSIRGYQYQKVGPLDDQNDPIGGRSVFEVSGEARFRLTEQIGLVPFVDGGTVFTNPDFTTDEDATIRWSAGLGGRYFTAIGPIRLDIAFPINKRKVDDTFQFYISIGQAF
jgi:translocation and assembly module TamA